VAQPPQFEGQIAAAAVIAEITDPAHEQKNIIVPTSLMVRETTAAI
jgi:DNA-binding LacI/PurR family transcriptional regulator